MCVCVCGVVCLVLCVCVWCGVGRWEGWWEKGGEASTMIGGWWALCADMCSTLVAGIHGETDGPNTREIVVGAFVVWCPPKYL